MLVLDPNAIWATYLSGEFHQPQHKKVLAVMEPYVKALPLVLARQLDNLVTLRSLLKSRIAFLDYCLTHDLPEAMSTAGPDYLRGKGSLVTRLLVDIIAAHRLVLASIPGLLERLEYADEIEYIVDQFELNEAMAAYLYDSKLTIGPLLLEQPIIFTRHT